MADRSFAAASDPSTAVARSRIRSNSASTVTRVCALYPYRSDQTRSRNQASARQSLSPCLRIRTSIDDCASDCANSIALSRATNFASPDRARSIQIRSVRESMPTPAQATSRGTPALSSVKSRVSSARSSFGLRPLVVPAMSIHKNRRFSSGVFESLKRNSDVAGGDLNHASLSPCLLASENHCSASAVCVVANVASV